MKIIEIRKIASTWGIDAQVGRSKQDIIRDIQINEGYSPCFGTNKSCDIDCLWKDDCTRICLVTTITALLLLLRQLNI
jgi:hypothetical protein